MPILHTIITQTNVPQVVCPTGSLYKFNSAIFFGFKSFTNAFPNNNNSGVYLGMETGKLPIVLTTGSNFSWNLSNPRSNDLNNFYVMGNINDGVYVITQ